jgi:hypothetical protein
MIFEVEISIGHKQHDEAQHSQTQKEVDSLH